MGPDEELAALIAERLIEGGLIDEDRRDEVSGRIAAGTATPEDWRFWIEVGPIGPMGNAGAAGHAQD